MKYFKDSLAGIIVALVSIPIGLGYAQIAGLPAVYGLYGSLLPILIFGILTTSKQFVVGVDAMPAVMVGSMLSTLGISQGSEEALKLVPVMTLLVSVWFIILFFLKAGRVVKYISAPVMGGFITGVGATIIMMQIPKLFGGSAGTGEIFQILIHIGMEIDEFNLLAFALGMGCFIVLQLSRKFIPKFPMSVLILLLGAVSTLVFHVDSYGVKTLPEVSKGLPKFILPDIRSIKDAPVDIIVQCLMIALVIMAQTLLASNKYATKYDETLDTNRELLAYSAANVAGALVGSCPINGSVSRTGIADQYGAKSQLMSIVASGTMLLVLLFGTPYLVYLPVPVLTAIVLSALWGILDIEMAKRLKKVNRNEFFIYLMAFVGVLVFGTIYGVVIGVILSFGEVIVRAVVPPKAFIGMIPGHDDLYSLRRNKAARPIKGAVMYRFGGNLFFANIGTFEEDIWGAIKDDTKCVIVDARGLGDIDITAADRLVILSDKLEARGIGFYMAEHGGHVNDELKRFGAGKLLYNGHIRRTVSLALRAAGIEKPYPLEGLDEDSRVSFVESSERLAEIQWAFGEESDAVLHKIAKEIAEHLLTHEGEEILEAERLISYGRIGLFDEEEMLDYLEGYLDESSENMEISTKEINSLHDKIAKRRIIVEEKLKKLNLSAYEKLIKNKHSRSTNDKNEKSDIK